MHHWKEGCENDDDDERGNEIHGNDDDDDGDDDGDDDVDDDAARLSYGVSHWHNRFLVEHSQGQKVKTEKMEIL